MVRGAGIFWDNSLSAVAMAIGRVGGGGTRGRQEYHHPIVHALEARGMVDTLRLAGAIFLAGCFPEGFFCQIGRAYAIGGCVSRHFTRVIQKKDKQQNGFEGASFALLRCGVPHPADDMDGSVFHVVL